VTDDRIGAVRREIAALPADWHGAGSVGPGALDALQRHAAAGRPLARSVETGTGRTTLLLSHLSADHTVFTQDDADLHGTLARVRSSPLLRESTVRFVIGPTQRTLLEHRFDHPIDFALLDGPHAYPFPDLEYWALYPHVADGGLLVVDDVQIPTIANLFSFLKVDAMWDLLEVVDDMAFFRRTSAPLVDPFGEGWWQQEFNRRRSRRHLSRRRRARHSLDRLKSAVPRGLKDPVKRWVGR
jgi:hypothetical protein